MADELFPRDRDKRSEETEGVRIIGAEEAEKASEREDVAQRLPEDAPRFGDRPESPPEGGPRPAIRFPLSGSSDPTDIERPPVVPPDPPRTSGEVSMPHWPEPPTGEVPRIFAADEGDDDLEAWSSFTSSQPRWHGEGVPDDEYDDFSRLADDETRVGALDPNRPAPNDYYDFDEEIDDVEPVEQSTRAISSDPRRATRNQTGGGGGSRGPSVAD